MFAIALLGAVLPCLGWLVFFYTRDKHEPEPKGLIARLFLIGALPVAVIAGILNTVVFLTLTGGDLTGPTAQARFVLLAVVVAPITEETLKYLGTSVGARRNSAFNEPMDGIVYGTTVGLGFAAVETIDYLINAYRGFGPLGTPIDFCEAGGGVLPHHRVSARRRLCAAPCDGERDRRVWAVTCGDRQAGQSLGHRLGRGGHDLPRPVEQPGIPVHHPAHRHLRGARQAKPAALALHGTGATAPPAPPTPQSGAS